MSEIEEKPISLHDDNGQVVEPEIERLVNIILSLAIDDDWNEICIIFDENFKKNVGYCVTDKFRHEFMQCPTDVLIAIINYINNLCVLDFDVLKKNCIQDRNASVKFKFEEIEYKCELFISIVSSSNIEKVVIKIIK